ncbi:uncharacterized protein KGF55_003817 [Candida pseudojiufengensis]|uniref:uncharacterized protein n=1 Tax=Candida pseudojiufengensis TaxID=497109 RepID=UPI00222552A1|nr:uncharacterized protein KGF55_003817 [Candida pseudojiufengensis]KAI5961846.1 hypothetical protein KGF55_003817 [Candida pseudojiufengensis]
MTYSIKSYLGGFSLLNLTSQLLGRRAKQIYKLFIHQEEHTSSTLLKLKLQKAINTTVQFLDPSSLQVGRQNHILPWFKFLQRESGMRGLSFNNFLNQVKKELTTAESSWLDAWFKIIKNKPTPLARNFLIEVDRNEMYDYICKSREKELENLCDMKDKEINSETFHHISRKTATTKPIIPNWISNEGLDYDEQAWKKFWTTLYSF